MTPAQPRIAIIGGGPAGLTLGALLHRQNIPFAIYELRPRPTEADLAAPSAMLDLHDDSGLAALRACGLYEAFLPYTADCEESLMIRDKAGALLHEDKGGLANRPEIARNNITRLFLSVLPVPVPGAEEKEGGEEGGNATIRYGHKLLSATRDDATGEVTLEFRADRPDGDGTTTTTTKTTATYDLVVGADGAWSRVRPLLSPARPDPTPLSYLQLYVPDVTARHPALAARVGRGTMMVLGDGHALGTQRGTRDAMQLYVFVNAARAQAQAQAQARGVPDADADADAVAALRGLSIPEQKARLLSAGGGFFGGYGESMKEVLRVAFDEEEEKQRRAASKGEENGGGDGGQRSSSSSSSSSSSLEVRPLVMLPIGHAWAHRPGVTLIGDAAHVMTPFAGEGVNLAMRDALDLSRAIATAFSRHQEQEDNHHHHHHHHHHHNSNNNREGGGKGREAFRAALSPLVRDFEKEMCERAARFSQESYDNMVMQMAEDGAERMATIMSAIYESGGQGLGGGEGGPGAVSASMSLEEAYEKVKKANRVVES